jgi:putative transposase
MDEKHVFFCARYIEMNPVRANLVKHPEDWPYSSAKAHIEGRDDKLVTVKPLLELMASDWREYLLAGEEDIDKFQSHERTGRPMGSDDFISVLEKKLGRKLKKSKAGRKPKPRNIDQK